ncbi:MAG: hypothetical protein V2I56_02850 [Desulfobacteraceae bacterium]|jgi:hypothetical protein|nr:hypothetical protein [Desulfobacteraceae bacterium]
MNTRGMTYLAGLFAILTGFFLLAGCSGNKNAKPAIEMGEQTTITATVEAIDYDTREVTIKGPQGGTVTLKVGEDAHNFNNIEVGDLVDIQYRTSVAIELREATGAEPFGSTEQKVVRAPGGQKPQGVISDTINVRAIVEKIDYKTRMVNLKGPNGNIITVQALDNVENFKNIKPGDEVLATYTEAMAYSVRPAKK